MTNDEPKNLADCLNKIFVSLIADDFEIALKQKDGTPAEPVKGLYIIPPHFLGVEGVCPNNCPYNSMALTGNTFYKVCSNRNVAALYILRDSDLSMLSKH